eukprot:2068864-Pleurochrysis_carterae.AAC.2
MIICDLNGLSSTSYNLACAGSQCGASITNSTTSKEQGTTLTDTAQQTSRQASSASRRPQRAQCATNPSLGQPVAPVSFTGAAIQPRELAQLHALVEKLGFVVQPLTGFGVRVSISSVPSAQLPPQCLPSAVSDAEAFETVRDSTHVEATHGESNLRLHARPFDAARHEPGRLLPCVHEAVGAA